MCLNGFGVWLLMCDPYCGRSLKNNAIAELPDGIFDQLSSLTDLWVDVLQITHGCCVLEEERF